MTTVHVQNLGFRGSGGEFGISGFGVRVSGFTFTVGAGVLDDGHDVVSHAVPYHQHPPGALVRRRDPRLQVLRGSDRRDDDAATADTTTTHQCEGLLCTRELEVS